MTTRARIHLIEERKRHQWSQQELADHLGTTQNNVSRWELGTTTPDSYFRLKLCELFGKTAPELDLPTGGKRQHASDSQSGQSLISTSERAMPPIWQIPFHRNLFFTGREQQLTHLFEQLHRSRSISVTRIQAISGLAGIGKTQIALEYAYRYAQSYRVVFWIRAETHEVLLTDFAMLASYLQLPGQNMQEQQRVVQKVRGWLDTHPDWLLLLDNVEDLTLLEEVLPPRLSGHILLTTRMQVTGTRAHRFALEGLEEQEGALFLLRRTKCIAPDALFEEALEDQRIAARKISHMMDGLPLALDQAGAYIEETGCSLSDYLDLYQTRRTVLLSRRGTDENHHPESVASTFTLSVEKVERANPAAVDLLRLCAFLHPDAISQEIIVEGACELGPVLASVALDSLALDSAIKDLRKFSLLVRHAATKSFALHRLLQAVLKDGMDAATQRQWAERAVRAVNHVFPDVEFATWQRCQSLLPHAQVCAILIKQWNMMFPEAVRLLQQTGNYLRECAQYGQAEPFFRQALSIREQNLGTEHPAVAECLANLAELNYYQGKYAQAESLFQRALSIRERILGARHPTVAENLNKLGELSYYQGKYAQAESLYQQALHIREQSLGTEHPAIAEHLHNLGHILYIQGKYTQAEPLLQRALAVSEQALGLEHPNVAYSLNSLGNLFRVQGKYTQAEPLLQRALAMREQVLGLEHPRTAESSANLGLLFCRQGKYALAENRLTQAQAIYEKVLGGDHPNMAALFTDLAELSRILGRYTQAEALFLKALAIHEKRTGLENHRAAQCMNGLAELYRIQGISMQAAPLCRRALDIRQKTFGPEHPSMVSSLSTLARLSLDEGAYRQADQLFQQSLHLCEKTMGSEHPDLVQILNNVAELYFVQDQYISAEAAYHRAVGLGEKTLGPQHPDVAQSFSGWGLLLTHQGKYSQAESLLQQALAMYEQTFGPEHLTLAQCLDNLAHLYMLQGEYAQAESLVLRSLAIREKVLGPQHPSVGENLHILAKLSHPQGKSQEAEIFSQQTSGMHDAAHHSNKTDSLDRWLEACCTRDETAWTPNAAIMQSHRAWCERQQQEPMSMKALTIALRRRGLLSRLRRVAHQNGSQPARGIQGIRVRL